MPQFHPESPDVAPQDLARLRFLADFRKVLHHDLGKGNRAAYDLAGGDVIASAADPAGRREQVRAHMEGEPFFREWSSMLRASQDLLWQTVDDSVARDEDRLALRLKSLHNEARGSVTVDPAFVPPAYITDEDTHRMPGGYFADAAEQDMRAGALYDLGGAVYQFGIGNASGGLLNDSRGRTLVAHLRTRFPDLAPRRILDLGCCVGHNTVPLALAFPDAEVVGLDVGAAQLRYAHLRAEGLGARVHFVQGDAEQAPFADGSFDLVTSQIILHETSPEAMKRIIAESRRLLRDGGVVVHLEVPLRAENGDDFQQFLWLWEQYYNTEPNISGVLDDDFTGITRAAGFDRVAFGYQQIPGPGETLSPFSEKPGNAQFRQWMICSGVAA